MIALTIFASTFILVFALGFQSLNVNNGHYKAAFWTSFAISISNLVLFKTLPQADPIQIAAYLSGGPFGIVTSMWAHRRLMTKLEAPTNVPKPAPWPAPPENQRPRIYPYAMRGDLLDVLTEAEAFIAGFEDDENQEGLDLLLAALREKIAEIEPPPPQTPTYWVNESTSVQAGRTE